MNNFAKMIGYIVLGFGVVFFIATFMAFPVKWTWNEVMPYLFGFKEIGFWQAWSLMFLAGSLIKSNSTSSSK